MIHTETDASVVLSELLNPWCEVGDLGYWPVSSGEKIPYNTNSYTSAASTTAVKKPIQDVEFEFRIICRKRPEWLRDCERRAELIKGRVIGSGSWVIEDVIKLARLRQTPSLLISDLGWTPEDAWETRSRFAAFEEDWNAPGMELYDEL